MEISIKNQDGNIRKISLMGEMESTGDGKYFSETFLYILILVCRKGGRRIINYSIAYYGFFHAFGKRRYAKKLQLSLFLKSTGKNIKYIRRYYFYSNRQAIFII